MSAERLTLRKVQEVFRLKFDGDISTRKIAESCRDCSEIKKLKKSYRKSSPRSAAALTVLKGDPRRQYHKMQQKTALAGHEVFRLVIGEDIKRFCELDRIPQ